MRSLHYDAVIFDFSFFSYRKKMSCFDISLILFMCVSTIVFLGPWMLFAPLVPIVWLFIVFFFVKWHEQIEMDQYKAKHFPEVIERVNTSNTIAEIFESLTKLQERTPMEGKVYRLFLEMEKKKDWEKVKNKQFHEALIQIGEDKSGKYQPNFGGDLYRLNVAVNLL